MKTFKVQRSGFAVLICYVSVFVSIVSTTTSADENVDSLELEPKLISELIVGENETETSNSSDTVQNGNRTREREREGRGLLDTIQGFVQTAQTVTKLFENSNLHTIMQNPFVQGLIKNQLQGSVTSTSNNYQEPQRLQQQQQQQQHVSPGNAYTNADHYYHQQQQSQNHIYGGSSSGALNTNSNSNSKYGNYNNINNNPHYGSIAQSSQNYPVSSSISNNNNYHNNRFPTDSAVPPGPAPAVPQSLISSFLQSQQQQTSHSQNQNHHQNGINVNKQGFAGLGNGGLGGVAGLLGNGGLGGASGLGSGGLGGVASLLGNAGLGGIAGPGGSSGSGNGDILSTLGELGLVEDLTDLLSFANVEKLLKNVNKFDSLQCIPRLVCQTIAKRQQDAADAEREALRTSTSTTTTTTTTRRPNKYKNNKRKDSTETTQSSREGRLIPGLKIQGMDTALEQVVKFLDLMQLKDWSLYPYLKGAYHGNQVKTMDECAEQFSSCPFSEDQLLYYFNNYKGGLFQSFRSDLMSTSTST